VELKSYGVGVGNPGSQPQKVNNMFTSKSENKHMNSLLTVQDVAEILQVSIDTIRKYVRMECIPYVKLTSGKASAVRFREESLEAWLLHREVNHERQKWSGAGQDRITKIMSSSASTGSSGCKLHACKDLKKGLGRDRDELGRISNITAAFTHHFTPRYTAIYQNCPYWAARGDVCLN